MLVIDKPNATLIVISILIGFGLLMIYLLIGGYNELLAAENNFSERNETQPDSEGGEILYDGKFDFGGCDCDTCNSEHGSSGSGRTDVQGAKKHPRMPRRA